MSPPERICRPSSTETAISGGGDEEKFLSLPRPWSITVPCCNSRLEIAILIGRWPGASPRQAIVGRSADAQSLEHACCSLADHKAGPLVDHAMRELRGEFDGSPRLRRTHAHGSLPTPDRTARGGLQFGNTRSQSADLPRLRFDLWILAKDQGDQVIAGEIDEGGAVHASP
jgi:hypothetical protein